MSEGYNELYAKREKAFGQRPDRVVLQAAELLPQDAEVLELGAGQGRNSLILAERRFNVTATDISPIGLDSINKLALEKGLGNIKTRELDARNGIEGEYDLLVATLLLHHLSPQEAQDLIGKMKLHTKQGGLNAITTFTKDGDFYKARGEMEFYPDESELRNIYSDWEILNYDEEQVGALAKRPDGTPMTNTRASLLARKIHL